MRNTEILDELPGCGFASYAMLLVVLGLLGSLVAVGSCLVVFQGVGSGGPSPLMPGEQVPVRQLDPMREAGLLELGETPLAYHDESRSLDGSAACALRPLEVVKVDHGVPGRLSFAKVDSVAVLRPGAGMEQVVIRGAGTEISCAFREGEGADRFGRQIEAEHQKTVAVPSTPPGAP